MKAEKLNRSILITCFMIGAIYAVVYVNSCYKINIKASEHDFVGDFLLGVGLLLAGALFVTLVNYARSYQRGAVEFDHDAVEAFGRRYGIFSVIGLFGAEALNFLIRWLGIQNKTLLNIPRWLMILIFLYVLYAGILAIYRSLLKTENT